MPRRRRAASVRCGIRQRLAQRCFVHVAELMIGIVCRRTVRREAVEVVALAVGVVDAERYGGERLVAEGVLILPDRLSIRPVADDDDGEIGRASCRESV